MMKGFTAISVILLFFTAINLSAEEVYRYRIFEEDSGKELGVQTVRVIKEGETLEVRRVYRDHQQPQKRYQTLSVLASDLSTLRYVVEDELETSDYQLTIKEDLLQVKGIFRGKPLEGDLNIGKAPFYHDPSISLSRFALSGEKKQIFQVVNPDDQTIYEMVATRQGETKIQIGDQRVEAVEVKWTLTGFRSMFFNQVFWFRKADGVFLTQKKASENRRSELMIE